MHLLFLHWKTRFSPLAHPPEYHGNTRVAVLVQRQRRTGAGVLRRSSSVEYDILIAGEFIQA
jgi:hypothetical protein